MTIRAAPAHRTTPKCLPAAPSPAARGSPRAALAGWQAAVSPDRPRPRRPRRDPFRRADSGPRGRVRPAIAHPHGLCQGRPRHPRARRREGQSARDRARGGEPARARRALAQRRRRGEVLPQLVDRDARILTDVSHGSTLPCRCGNADTLPSGSDISGPPPHRCPCLLSRPSSHLGAHLLKSRQRPTWRVLTGRGAYGRNAEEIRP